MIFIVPLITAFFGWLIHKMAMVYILKSYWPKIQSELSQTAVLWAGSNFSFDQIERKIADPVILDNAMPSIEAHIDTFLNEKLQQEIPMLSMFVGTKTTDKIKEIFIAQLKQLFPVVMAQMVIGFKKNFNFETTISEKLKSPEVQQSMKSKVAHQLKHLPVLGLINGFIAGVISALIFYFSG